MEPTPTSLTAEAVTQKVPIDKIKPSPFQARTEFPEESIGELSHNIQEQGLIQPLTVRLMSDGTYELIGGERRLRAVKLLGWTTVRAQILPGVDDQKAAELGLIDNLQREDLNALERAQGYKKLGDMGLSLEAIAMKVGLGDKSTISRYLALLDLPQEVQEMLPRGNISEKHTRSLRQISNKAKQIEVARQADKEGWSVKETEKRVNSVLGNPIKEPKSSKAPENPNLNSPIEPVWNKMVDLGLPHHQGLFAVLLDYKGKYKWTFTVDPQLPQDLKDPAKTTAPALAQGLAQALHEMAEAFEKAGGPVVVRPAVELDGGQPEQRLAGEVAPPPAPAGDDEKKKPRGIVPQRAAVPVPHLKEARYIPGNKLEVHWESLGEGFTYRLFRAYETDYPKYMPLTDGAAVSTPGAVVNIRPYTDEKSQMIAVMAIDPQGQESELSDGVAFELKPWNQEDAVTSLPMATASVPSAVSPPTPNPSMDEERNRRIAAVKAKYGRIL